MASAQVLPAQANLSSPTSMAEIIAKLADEDEARLDAEEEAMDRWEEEQWMQQQAEEEELARAQADAFAKAIEETYDGDDSQVVVTPEMRQAMLFMANATAAEQAEAARIAAAQVAAVAGEGEQAAAADAAAADPAAALPLVLEEDDEDAAEQDSDLPAEDRYQTQPSPRRAIAPATAMFAVPITDDAVAAAEAMFGKLAAVQLEDEEQGEEEFYAEEERLYNEEVLRQQAEAEALMRHVEAEDEGLEPLEEPAESEGVATAEASPATAAVADAAAPEKAAAAAAPLPQSVVL